MAPDNEQSREINTYGVPQATPNDLTRWHRFDTGGHPDYVADNSLSMHVIWCIWHEGLPYYRHSPLMTINEFRKTCIAYQPHNAAARTMINDATNSEIAGVLRSMVDYFGQQQNGGYQMLYKHLAWVLHHEGMRKQVLSLLDQGNFNEIRSIYTQKQAHNAHVHHLIDAASDQTIRSLVNDMKG